jgi:predicted nucleic acid-binding protein
MKELGLRDTSLASVMSIAKDERTTFYDSSYIAIAKARALTLVTDDRRLSKVASRYVNVKSSTSL